MKEETPRPSILALDFGTSSVKAGLIDVTGRLLWSGRRVFPKVPDYTNWHSKQWLFSMEEIFDDFAVFCQGSAGKYPEAIVVSGNGPTLVMLGNAYKDQRRASWPVLLWMTAQDMAITGNKSLYLPKINWMKAHRPESFNDVELFMPTAEYISWVLSGQACTVSPNDRFSEYMWTKESLENYDLPASLFPDYCVPGSIIGSIDKIGSTISGLPQGIPLIAGGSDFLMSLLGTGVIEEGLCCDRAGTSEGINYCSTQQLQQEGLRVIPHFRQGYYNVAGILSYTGRMFEWFRGISHQQKISYIEMMKSISAVPSDNAAPWFFPSAHRGNSWEFKSGIFAGLQPEHGSAELGRAVVNAIAFSIRSTLASLRNAGCGFSSMRSCGGQAKNDVWCQMKANIAAVSIEVPHIQDAELTGSAIMGFVGMGRVGSIEEGVSALVRMEKRFDPDPDSVDMYSSQYHSWMKSFECIRDAAILSH